MMGGRGEADVVATRLLRVAVPLAGDLQDGYLQELGEEGLI